jgi:hypothetical protein
MVKNNIEGQTLDGSKPHYKATVIKTKSCEVKNAQLY